MCSLPRGEIRFFLAFNNPKTLFKYNPLIVGKTESFFSFPLISRQPNTPNRKKKVQEKKAYHEEQLHSHHTGRRGNLGAPAEDFRT